MARNSKKDVGTIIPIIIILIITCNVQVHTIILLLKCVCRSSQTADRSSSSIVSGDVSNCSHRLKALPLVSTRLSLA